MSEMIERVAKALVEAWPSWGTWGDEEARKGARAAIEAMREPTEAMVIAGGKQLDCAFERQCWRAMIDAALK